MKTFEEHINIEKIKNYLLFLYNFIIYIFTKTYSLHE